MKFISKFALAFTLMALGAAPAAYAKEEKKSEKGAKPTKLKLSPEFLKAYKPGVDAYEAAQKAKDTDGKKAALESAKAIWPSIKAAIVNDDDKYQAAIYADTLAVQLQEASFRAESLPLFLSSTATPASDRPIYVYLTGINALNAKDYASAEKALLESYNAGHRPDGIETNISETYNALNNTSEALAWMKKYIERQVGEKKPVEARYYARAMLHAVKLNDPTQVDYWGKEMIKADPRPATYHDAIFQFDRVAGLNEQETLDLLRLAYKTKALLYDHEYAQYLEVVDQRRYPAEALAVLKEGTDKGIISPRNIVFSEVKTATTALLPELTASRTADENAAKAAAKGYTALLTGDAALSFADYAKAKELYEAALSKGNITDNQGVDQTDRLLMHMGIAKTYLGDFSGAKADFQKITGAKRKAVGEYWLIHVEEQMAPKAAAAPIAG